MTFMMNVMIVLAILAVCIGMLPREEANEVLVALYKTMEQGCKWWIKQMTPP